LTDLNVLEHLFCHGDIVIVLIFASLELWLCSFCTRL